MVMSDRMDPLPPPLPSGPPALPVEARYITRNHAFAETATWSLRAGALVIEEVNQPVRRIDLKKVKSLRLEFAPTRPEPNRFRCRITVSGGKVWDFFNRTYRGVYDFADTSAAYVEFLRALHGQLARHAPGCQFMAGASAGSYALNMGILIFVALVVVGALAFFLTVGLVWIAVIKVALMAFYTPVAIRWAKRNRPRSYAASDIPANVLPTGS